MDLESLDNLASFDLKFNAVNGGRIEKSVIASKDFAIFKSAKRLKCK